MTPRKNQEVAPEPPPPEIAPLEPAKASQEPCDHFFQDTNHCVKCGWTPVPDGGTIARLCQSLYSAHLEVVSLRANEVVLRKRVLDAETALRIRQELEADDAD